MDMDSEGPDVDEVVLQLLLQKAKAGRMKRAEKVMQPPQEAMQAEAPDEEMAELEAMLAEGGGEMQPETPCETCGKGYGECAC